MKIHKESKRMKRIVGNIQLRIIKIKIQGLSKLKDLEKKLLIWTKFFQTLKWQTLKTTIKGK